MALDANSVYWTSDAVQTIDMSIESISDEPIDPAAAAATAADVLAPIAGVAGGSDAAEWISARISDTSCLPLCKEVFQGATFALTVTEDGWHILHVVRLDP